MLLSFNNVSFSYPKSCEVLKNITFDISNGEKVALLGLNGSGKSTLMLHTNGLLIPTHGEVLVNGMSTRSKSLKEIRKKVGLVFQDADDQLFMPTVYDDVAFGPRNMKLSKEEIENRVEEALIKTKTKELSQKAPFELSGGQKKSVSIATVLSMKPELLVFDEPTSGMDVVATQNFIEIIKNLPQAILLSTHDIELAKTLCQRAIILDKGIIIQDCSIDKDFTIKKWMPISY